MSSSEKKEKIPEIGVMVGRFQLDRLHEGHIALIDQVTKRHKKTVLFLGVAMGQHKEEQALDYATREKMIKGMYPHVIVMPLVDMANDYKWSEQVDKKIREAFPHGKAMLYGGRDSFIPHYKGKWPTHEISNAINETATDRRSQISQEVRDSEDFRAGVIYHAANSYPNAFQCVDVAIIRGEPGNIKVLLGKKLNEDKYRFPGGHLDPSDDSLEACAKREAREEVGQMEISSPEYVTSMRVDDWRYRKSKNKIVTALFLCKYVYGRAEAADDIDSCEWIEVKDLLREGGIIEHVMPEHRQLMVSLLSHIGELKEQPEKSIA